jgi:hypothetical protein
MPGTAGSGLAPRAHVPGAQLADRRSDTMTCRRRRGDPNPYILCTGANRAQISIVS